MTNNQAHKATPAALWRAKGEPDPHGTRYDCERAKLANGTMTDDELANAVFLDPHIGNTTAAKDRIRWLSRQLVAKATAERQTASDSANIDRVALQLCQRMGQHGASAVALVAAAIRDERERCARIADAEEERHRRGGVASSMAEDTWGAVTAKDIAAAIRDDR